MDEIPSSSQSAPSSASSPLASGPGHSDLSREIHTGKYRPPTKASRRIRGEIACAECRRLKVRCDRTIPCSTCVKRGCAALCPNEIIPPGDGGRFVLAATNHLDTKIVKLEARMRSLEDALAIIHASESERPHPLLSFPDHEDDEYAQHGTVLQAVSDESHGSSDTHGESLGTLCLDANGGVRFFGPSGGSESLLQSTEPKSPFHILEELDPSYLSPDINQCFRSFPFTPPNVISSAVQRDIEAFLPSMERAVTLCDTFLEHLSWMFSIVSRHQLLTELIPVVYKQAPGSYGPHDLALLLIVLGVGSLVDLNLPPYNLEAQHYYRLSMASLVLQPVLGAQSIVTIKVLHLMSIYNGMSGKESNLEQSYALLDLAGQVALRIGFYIDPSMWGFEGREAYDRRVYFWNLMAGVLWQSLVTGRPPSLLTSYINCRIPSVDDENLFQEGEVPLGFGIWGFRASQECLIPVVRAVLAAKAPTYETVMELDSKIRNLAIPTQDTFSTQTDRIAVSMRIFVRSHYQDLMLMFLHRAHFAQAMMEHPENPLSSPYSRSVQSAYMSSCIVLRDTKDQFSKKPRLCARIWRMWSFAFTAAVIVGTVAVRGAHLHLKPEPLEEFETTVDVFSKAAETSNRAARAMPILQVMLQRARQAHRYYGEQGQPAPNDPGDEELQYLGGMKSIVKEGDSPKTSPPMESSQVPSRSSNLSYPVPVARPRILQRLPQPLPSTSIPAGSALRPGLSVAASVPPIAMPPASTRPPRLIIPELGTRPTTTHIRRDSQETPTERDFRHLQSPQTLADLSDGWTGMFHEVPEPQYTLPTSFGYGHSLASQVASTSRGADLESFTVRHPPLVQQSQHVPTPGNAPLMLDDRWASFMNYGFLDEPANQDQS